jgi:hypothetical protein
MATTYFMFKTLRIVGIGGLMPKGVHIVGSIGEWYYGSVENAETLWNIREYHPMIIDKETFDGLPLMDLTEMLVDPSNPESGTRAFTAGEAAAKDAALKLMKKFNIRARIESEVGDVYDLLADLAKRVSLVERPTLVALNDLMTTGTIAQTTKDAYAALIGQYVTGVSTGALSDRTDLEVNTELFARMTARYQKIHDIVKEEYGL